MATLHYVWTVGRVNRRGLTLSEIEDAVFEALGWYSKVLMKKHFAFGNAQRYGYKGLTPAYARQKMRKYGLKPILVRTGELKDDVLNTWNVTKIGNRYRISWIVPHYAKYQVKGGRDFRKPSQTEWQRVSDRIKSNLDKLRKGGSL